MTVYGSDLLTWWGAGLSTVLGVLKLFEAWRDRFRVDVGYSFSGNEEEGVLIRNLSNRPLLLTQWELLYATKTWPRKYEHLKSPLFDQEDLRIDPNGTKTLVFSDDEHFDWGVRTLKGRSIWIRLYIAGRRPITRRVFP